MTHRSGRIVRLVIMALVAAVVVAAGWKLSHRPVRRLAHPASGEVDVKAAVAASFARSSPEVVVRGYAFYDGLGFRLCRGEITTSPPQCIGPDLAIDGIDPGTFNLATGRRDGQLIRWVKGAVALRGTVRDARIQVSQVLQ